MTNSPPQPDQTGRIIQVIAALESRISILEQSFLRLQLEATRVSLSAIPDLHDPTASPFPTPRGPASPNEDWIPIPHANGETACGQPAQYLIRKVHRTEPPDLTLLRVYDRARPLSGWRIPDPSSWSVCSSCGAAIDPHSSEDLDWSGAIWEFGNDRTDELPPDIFEKMMTPRAAREQQTQLEQTMKAVQADQRTQLEQAMKAAREVRFGPDHDD